MITKVDADNGKEIIRSLWHKSDKSYTMAFPTKTLKLDLFCIQNSRTIPGKMLFLLN